MAVREDLLKKPSSIGSSQPSNYATALNNVRNNVAPAPSAPTAQPISRTNQTLNNMSQLSTANPFQFKGPDTFAYDQNNDPAYQAAMASARQNIAQQQADTNAMLRAGGQGKSSYSESVANQIGSKEMARISTDVLPQLISQAYQRYADQANRDMQVQQANYGAQQDQISNLARLYGLQNQQDFQNPMAEAQITGQYLSGEARQYIDAINALKQQAEMQGVTRDQMSGYRSQADAYRAALQGLGVDASLFGADVNRETAMGNMNSAGLQTLDARNQSFNQNMAQQQFDRGVLESDRSFDFQKAQQEWENNFKQGQFDWQKAQQTWENAFQEKNFQQQMKEAAASRGLQWANLNQRQKEFVADQAFREKQFDLETAKFDAQQSAPAKYDYKTDPEFVNGISWINSDPADALSKIRSSANAIIGQFGYNGYQEMLRAAESANRATGQAEETLEERLRRMSGQP